MEGRATLPLSPVSVRIDRSHDVIWFLYVIQLLLVSVSSTDYHTFSLIDLDSTAAVRSNINIPLRSYCSHPLPCSRVNLTPKQELFYCYSVRALTSVGYEWPSIHECRRRSHEHSFRDGVHNLFWLKTLSDNFLQLRLCPTLNSTDEITHSTSLLS